MKSLIYEIEAVISFVKNQGNDFKTGSVDKLVQVVQHKFSNEALLRTITALYRAGFHSPKEVAEKIPDSILTDSAALTKLAKKAQWLVAARNIIGRMKQLNELDADQMRTGFAVILSYFNYVVSEKHAQMLAMRYVLLARGFKVDSVNKNEVKAGLRYLESVNKEQANFDFKVFAGFLSSAKFIGTDLSNDTAIYQYEDYIISSEWFDDVGVLPWIILPPGEHPFPALIEHFKSLAKKYNEEFDEERLNRIYSLKPTARHKGLGKFDRYIICLFKESRKAVLESPFYGNAIYIVEGDWESLSRLTKKELLEDYPREVIRVIHSGDWFSRLKELLN
jgi:hypothetical protein